MKTIAILIIACIGIYFLAKGKSGSANADTSKPKGMQTALDNKNNKQGYPVGHAVDYEKSLKKYNGLSREELQSILEEEELNLYEVSNVLLVLANIHFQRADLETGLPLLETAAYEYHNPLAMVGLARANFQGYEEEPSGTVPVIIRDLEKAFYLVNRAFETAGTLDKLTGEKFALDRSVAGGLGILDSYNLSEVKREFNQEKHAARISKKVQKDVADFMKMFQLK